MSKLIPKLSSYIRTFFSFFPGAHPRQQMAIQQQQQYGACKHCAALVVGATAVALKAGRVCLVI